MKITLNFVPRSTCPRFPNAVMSADIRSRLENDLGELNDVANLIFNTAPEETAVLSIILAAVREKLDEKEE